MMSFLLNIAYRRLLSKLTKDKTQLPYHIAGAEVQCRTASFLSRSYTGPSELVKLLSCQHLTSSLFAFI